MNAKTEAAVRKHGSELLAIFPHATERDAVKLCKRLRRLEREGEAFALRLCNGPQFQSEEIEDKITSDILAKVDGLLQFTREGVPVFLNRDPRGYALKIESQYRNALWSHGKPIHSDFGGYGIIAPDLTETK